MDRQQRKTEQHDEDDVVNHTGLHFAWRPRYRLISHVKKLTCGILASFVVKIILPPAHP
jgi:hypothetical protein